MKLHLGHLLGLSAIIVAGCAAFFSVFGLSQLFAGASIAVIVMASSLELSKLVAASFLHRYWDEISTLLKIYLTMGVIVLVTITSAGIYGFLSNAYQKTAFTMEVHDGEIALMDGKIELFNNKIASTDEVIENKNKRISQLMDLRTLQEVRLDSMINRRYFSNANATRDEIEKANAEIEVLTNEVDMRSQIVNQLNDSIAKYEMNKLELQSTSDVAAELGPLKYMSELFNKPMDVIVNYFILLLIVVFDPLAISLVIATGWVFTNRSNKKSPSVEKEEEQPDNSDPEDYYEPEAGTTMDLLTETDDDNNTHGKEDEKLPQEPEPETMEEETSVDVEVDEEIPGETVEKPIEETKEVTKTERGFSVDIPKTKPSTNMVERIGSNKFLENNKKVVYKNSR